MFVYPFMTEMEISRLLYPMPSRSFPWQAYTVITMRSTTWTRSGNTQTSFGVLPILTARPWEMYISAAAVWIHPRSLPERRQIPSWRERIILMEKAVSIRKFPLLNPARPQKGPVKMERAYPVPPVIPSVRASYRTLFQEEIPEALQLSSTEKTTPAFAGTTVQVETTTSPLDSLAETAESVYMEETKPKVTIVRPGESKESQEMSSAASSAPQTSGSAGPTAASSQAPSPVSSEAPTPEPQPTEPTESRNAVIIRPGGAGSGCSGL